MIRPIYLIFELATYALFIACLWHAARQGRFRVLELLVSLLYGVLLELMTLRQLSAYRYGQFWIMIDDAPLSIGAGWAVIIYSAMAFSSRLEMPEAARPFLDGLLALNIDLAMDTIAIRLGMWTWGMLSLEQEWFGVPWGNFWAWYIVVTSYSAFLRALRPWRRHRILGWLYPLPGLLLSLAVLAITNRLYASLLTPIGGGFLGMLLLIGSGIFIVASVRPRVQEPGPPDPVALAVPVVFHLLFMGAGIAYGFYAQTPALAVIGITMLFVGVAVHLWPWWAQRAGRQAVEP